eukprot:GCRY01001614.1.p1 GENE.GCRY01001614.1~~GCRY01001614.1.p1  ORF type:complete len:453 (-),score=52.02 GCRY01001614.1:1542-2900(-)
MVFFGSKDSLCCPLPSCGEVLKEHSASALSQHFALHNDIDEDCYLTCEDMHGTAGPLILQGKTAFLNHFIAAHLDGRASNVPQCCTSHASASRDVSLLSFQFEQPGNHFGGEQSSFVFEPSQSVSDFPSNISEYQEAASFSFQVEQPFTHFRLEQPSFSFHPSKIDSGEEQQSFGCEILSSLEVQTETSSIMMQDSVSAVQQSLNAKNTVRNQSSAVNNEPSLLLKVKKPLPPPPEAAGGSEKPLLRTSFSSLAERGCLEKTFLPNYNGDKPIRIASWNINGLNSFMEDPRYLSTFMKEQNIDILCLQETKQSDFRELNRLLDERNTYGLKGYQLFWSNSINPKGYAGTAVFSRYRSLSFSFCFCKPKNGKTTGVIEEEDEGTLEGRIITVEFPTFFLVNTYVPNSGMKLARYVAGELSCALCNDNDTTCASASIAHFIIVDNHWDFEEQWQ